MNKKGSILLELIIVLLILLALNYIYFSKKHQPALVPVEQNEAFEAGLNAIANQKSDILEKGEGNSDVL